MQIDRNSWHYKVYALTYKEVNSYLPEKTNLCTYARYVFLWSWMVVIAYAAVIMGFYTIIMPLALLVGWRPTLKLFKLTTYQGLSVGSFRLYPWHMIVPVLIILINYAVLIHHNHGEQVFIFGAEGCILALSFVLTVAAWMEINSEKTYLVRSWMDAKLSGVCPVVEFDPPEDEDDYEELSELDYEDDDETDVDINIEHKEE